MLLTWNAWISLGVMICLDALGVLAMLGEWLRKTLRTLDWHLQLLGAHEVDPGEGLQDAQRLCRHGAGADAGGGGR